MASELDFIIQYFTFIGKWVHHFLWSNPQVLLILVLILIATALAWRLLTQKSLTVMPGISIFLIVMLVTCMVRERRDIMEVVRRQGRLAAAHKQINEGVLHREELADHLHGNLIEEEQGDDENPLDGCLHVFLDLGSNRGVQIRKLYEPHVFPLAPVQPLYQRFFGKPEQRNLQEICSVSFEPSSKHAESLQELAKAYATCGIRVVVYKAGVGDKNTKTKLGHFNTFFGHEIGNDAAARLIDENATKMMFEELHEDIVTEEVEVIRFATFLTEVVAKRKLPRSASIIEPKVVVKSDIEGAELKILLDMVATGSLSHVDNIHMEWHGAAFYRADREAHMVDKLAKAVTNIAELTQREGIEDKFEIEEMDDETYSGIGQFKPWGDFSDLPLLEC